MFLPMVGRVAMNSVFWGLKMGEFFSNVSRYPKYLITIVLGVFTAAISPLIKRGSNPITAIALVGALLSGLMTIIFLLKAMAFPSPIT